MFDAPAYIESAYLVSAVLFVLGIRRLSSPATARSGNAIAAAGMLIAIAATLFNEEIVTYWTLAIGIAVGAILGGLLARTIRMTAMPQMVASFNGLGGGASALIATGEFLRLSDLGDGTSVETLLTIAFGSLVGVVTLFGSLVAVGKLQGFVRDRPVTYPLQKSLNLLIFLAILALAGYLVAADASLPVLVAILLLATLLGVLLVLPIGGADMPVVISLLNSYSGIAASAAGFVLDNTVLIISGALVGAAGLILTRIMSKAMNRSLANVFFGAVGAVAAETRPGASDDKVARSVTADEAAIVLGFARSVIFVPGYGLAVAQAQHGVAELATALRARGATVRYAIHPVAGRMPGHMNVLLAEAKVAYDELYDLDDVNPEFDRADVAVVIGANDVTNPDARNMADSPLYGMPILNVDQAASVVIIKRSLSPGFAGVDNPLFYLPKTMMFFSDARKAVTELVAAVKEME